MSIGVGPISLGTTKFSGRRLVSFRTLTEFVHPTSSFRWSTFAGTGCCLLGSARISSAVKRPSSAAGDSPNSCALARGHPRDGPPTLPRHQRAAPPQPHERPAEFPHPTSHRPHRALNLKPPNSAARKLQVMHSPTNLVERRERLGGLIHEYRLAA
jgi:hypothetical protein